MKTAIPTIAAGHNRVQNVPYIILENRVEWKEINLLPMQNRIQLLLQNNF